MSEHLFEKCWREVKEFEQSGGLTVEEAMDVATRLPQALFVAMMEALAEAGEDPRIVITQIRRVHAAMLLRLEGTCDDIKRTPPQTRIYPASAGPSTNGSGCRH